jgi:hypothetical protein
MVPNVVAVVVNVMYALLETPVNVTVYVYVLFWVRRPSPFAELSYTTIPPDAVYVVVLLPVVEFVKEMVV